MYTKTALKINQVKFAQGDLWYIHSAYSYNLQLAIQSNGLSCYYVNLKHAILMSRVLYCTIETVHICMHEVHKFFFNHMCHDRLWPVTSTACATSFGSNMRCVKNIGIRVKCCCAAKHNIASMIFHIYIKAASIAHCCYTIKFVHSGCLHRSNLNVLCSVSYVD